MKRAAAAKAIPRERLEAHAGNAMHRLDRLIHERLRLGIVSALASNPSLTFIELRSMLETSDGNLCLHARKLEDAGYIECMKSFEGRLPRTEYKLTAAGKRALRRYVDHMEAIIEMMRR